MGGDPGLIRTLPASESSAAFPPESTASTFTFVGFLLIARTVTQKFCDTCDRVRLTADGQFRNCLFAVDEYDVRALLRGGATDDEICELLERGVMAKWAGHGIGDVHFIRPKRSMSQIGG